jgi:hypothetical protein
MVAVRNQCESYNYRCPVLTFLTITHYSVNRDPRILQEQPPRNTA